MALTIFRKNKVQAKFVNTFNIAFTNISIKLSDEIINKSIPDKEWAGKFLSSKERP
ncbi:MAG: hypothetical protein NVSMB66_3520 [Candidatus Doudnabacteria bacterium]